MDLGNIHEEEIPLYELASWDMPGRTFKQQVRGRRLNGSTRSTKKKKQ